MPAKFADYEDTDDPLLSSDTGFTASSATDESTKQKEI